MMTNTTMAILFCLPVIHLIVNKANKFTKCKLRSEICW